MGTKGKELEGKKIALCITGSVAAAQSPQIARELMRHGAEVLAIMSPQAKRIIHPDLMEWATGNQVFSEMNGKIEFISLSKKGPGKIDLVLIAPCTANTLGKLAGGINDTPVTAIAISAFSSGIPILIAPAMHSGLLNYPLTQKNISELNELGFEFIEPRIEEDKAKISDVEDIVEAVIRKLTPKDMVGLNLLVTSGPTYEHIDPIRIITNKSSGKMGIAIAKIALRRGANVTLVYGPGTVKPPSGIKVIPIETTEDMVDAVKSELKTKVNMVIAASAAADFTLEKQYANKISTSKFSELTLKLKPTRKVIREAKKASPNTFIVAFKAEYNVSEEELANRAYERLRQENIDLIVANDVGKRGIGFQCDTNEVLIIDKEKNVIKISIAKKDEVAGKILDVALQKIHKPATGLNK